MITKMQLLAGIGMFALVVSTASGQIRGSKHDFSGTTWAKGEVCIPCHTPHNAIDLQDSPLWNHELTNATFTVFSSSTLKQTPEQPRGPSKLCLSCHDGTVALDSYGGATGSTTIQGDARLGTDLSDDHPISIKWVHQTGQKTCSNCHFVHSPTDTLPFYDGYLECATCHEVHNDLANEKLLRFDPAGSKLCFHCHDP